MADKDKRVSDATKEADRKAMNAEHGAPQVPTAAEAEAADRHGKVKPGTSEHYDEMAERGAKQKGEGRLP